MTTIKDFWRDKRILLTGGAGFLGRCVQARLRAVGVDKDNIIIFDLPDYDLTKEADVARLFSDNNNIDLVIHLAGDVGGIGYNRKYPGKVFYSNMMMNTLTMEYARRAGVKKFIGIGSVCSYPKFSPVPFKEDDLWNGYPEETNATYGLAKKMMLVQGQAYRQEFDFNAIHLLMINLFGPGDNFDLENSHVIAALIRKFLEAKETNQPEVEAWGTGKASREFLYVEDAAKAIVLAASDYNQPEPVNIGAGCETTIKDLMELIVKLTGYKGKVVWNTSKPDGQPRRCLETSRAAKFGFKSETSLEIGLKKTIDWYLNNKIEGRTK